jgi:hypothetical protein
MKAVITIPYLLRIVMYQRKNEVRKITKKITEKYKQLVLEIRKKHPKLGKENKEELK